MKKEEEEEEGDSEYKYANSLSLLKEEIYGHYVFVLE